jgi:membrane protease YdiL (CAAX protease family)
MQDERSTVNATPPGVPWTGTELLIAVFLVFTFWPPAVYETLKFSGFYPWYYGPELVTTASKAEASSVRQSAQYRLMLWALVLASPFQVLTYPLVFGVLSGTRPSQLGLTRRQFGRNVLRGVVGMVLLTPIVLGLYQLLQYLYARPGESPFEKHQLEILADQPLYPAEWFLLVLVATVCAPVLEEVTFRGVLQPWLAARAWGGHLAMALAWLMALVRRSEQLATAWGQGWRGVLGESAPVLFILGLVPIYLVVWWRSRTPVWPAIFGVATLFASVHASVWPSPVPLFLLALGLGHLAQRTQSLVGPIVLHGLFNGVSCIQLLWHTP